MTALITALVFALAAQAADDRYPDSAAAEQAFAGEQSAAEPSAGDAAAEPTTDQGESTITLPPETPQPTLADTQPPAPGADATETETEPSGGVDSSILFDGAPDEADQPPADGVAAAPTPAGPTTPVTPTEPIGSPATAAAADQPVADQPVADDAPKPADLMQALLTTPASGQLAGVPLSLGAALRDAATRADQTARTQAYWELSAAVAQYYLALQEHSELAALRGGIAAAAPAWELASSDADDRVALARGAAVAAQRRMHALLGSGAGPSLPLPADAPHCGRYNTRYSEIFVNRQDPEAAEINELLPLLHSQLATLTRQVDEADKWLAYVVEHRHPANDGAGVLHSYQLMTERRRAFIDAACAYNQQIAAYAERATPDAVGPDRLVAMLIRTSYAAGQADDQVAPASATADVQSPDAVNQAAVGARGNGTPRTFAWRPFERLRERERSIVTARRKAFRPLRNLME